MSLNKKYMAHNVDMEVIRLNQSNLEILRSSPIKKVYYYNSKIYVKCKITSDKPPIHNVRGENHIYSDGDLYLTADGYIKVNGLSDATYAVAKTMIYADIYKLSIPLIQEDIYNQYIDIKEQCTNAQRELDKYKSTVPELIAYIKSHKPTKTIMNKINDLDADDDFEEDITYNDVNTTCNIIQSYVPSLKNNRACNVVVYIVYFDMGNRMYKYLLYANTLPEEYMMLDTVIKYDMTYAKYKLLESFFAIISVVNHDQFIDLFNNVINA